ncbi:cation:proton antiporter [Secundilactobacillus mixtipabuli]|uniref:Na+/H+ antiporter n=1 Tax=Secundilactobacillus mixtipabuli TaxID=1435342 RepID=A0A1Z5I9G1_9LACO|nr:sodium:proton antiporter [Secundilactobacillus mixtipabuli]GAW98426.1 Na+/H+ antiporter [Secundilactobacillus mixtipabuli]
MDQVLLLIIILAVVVLANILSRHLTVIPLPFFLILLGLVLALLPAYSGFHLDPSTFAFAIIAPMLFNEAQNSSRFWIGRSITNILSLAVGLVVVTVLVVGTSIHALFTVLPLSLSFALIAIVAPTDASAVNSIFEANPIAEEQSATLQHESLFNDAAGIVIFDIALAAFMSGRFSIEAGIGMFAWEFLGGLLFGAIIGVIVVSARLFLIRHNDDTPLIMVLIQLLTPFLVYLLAEKLELSGILAVVAAGMVQGSERDKLRLTSSRMQLVTSNVWEIVSGVLSGTVFVLLGLSLPDVIRALNAHVNPQITIPKLLLLGLFLYVLKGAIRLVWTRFLLKRRTKTDHVWRDSLVMALSGANGTITLSLAFSIPTMANGHPFLLRGPLIFLAAVVILTSLLLPTIFVPLLLPSEQGSSQPRFKWLRRMIQAGISDLATEKKYSAEAQIVIDSLQQQLILDSTPNLRIERQIMRQTHKVESDKVREMYESGQITEDEMTYYNKFLELNHFSADEKVWKNVWLRIRFSLHIGTLYKDLHRAQEAFLTAPVALEEVYWREQFEKHGENILPIEEAGFEAVMAYLKQNSGENGVETNLVRRFYRTRHRRIRGGDVDPNMVYQLFMRAFHAEYELIQRAIAKGDISADLAEKLQQRISFDEITYIQNSESYR